MTDEQRIHPGHSNVRRILRIVGPVLLGLGILFTVIGIGSFFLAMGRGVSGGEMRFPSFFFLAFIGGPFIVFGFAITAFGFMGAVSRYQAAEVAPVGKDTFNYLADGTKDGVKTVAGAIGEGLAGGMGRGTASTAGEGSRTIVRCQKCNAENDADAKFCDNCGEALQKSVPCPGCGELNDPDARFCDGCGKPLR